MSNVVLTIDGKQVTAKEGEFILNVARANNIFVPAICYLTRCSPTLACRLCLVEADGKQVYACNAKVKDGMNVSTVTENIVKERRAIMEVYDVNHPLQCGVCDQSGECELQNYSLYMNVDKQNYCIKDVPRPAQNWGVMKYDPGLCIVCEKCVTVCKDMIGSNALGTVKRGAEEIDKDFKSMMPKDAYAMWNKLNKSLIGFEADKCTDCGECIAVCPVGALVSSDFQYKSNAWELTKIPAANPHSSDCAFMYYEVKHENIENNQSQKIYRVTNESHYESLSGAARFGYDFQNKVDSKDEKAFAEAVESFKSSDTIRFNSFITNEEALILQKLKEKFGYKLVNEDALRYQRFMNAYSGISGKSLYNGSMSQIHESNLVVSVGSFLKSDAPNVRYAFNNAISLNKGAGLYFHPIADPVVNGFGKKGKTIESVNYQPMQEEVVLYALLELFGDKSKMATSIANYLDSFVEIRQKQIVETIKEEVEEKTVNPETGEETVTKKMVPKKVTTVSEFSYSTLFEKIGVNEELFGSIKEMVKDKNNKSLIIGEDCINNPRSQNIARLAAMLEECADFKVVIIPTQTNTLGVSLICELDEIPGTKVIGYNESGDFVLSALGDGNLDMPALNQQEGTFTNINKRVVPTNAAVNYFGYELNDIANALGVSNSVSKLNTIDYTQELPGQKGYTNAKFDDLPNYFANDMEEIRGYLLLSQQTEINGVVEEISTVSSLGQNVIYLANPINQFNGFTAICHELKSEAYFGVSPSFANGQNLSDGDFVTLSANGVEIKYPVLIDKQIEGNIGYVPTFDKNVQSAQLFNHSRYSSVNLVKV